MRLLLPDLDGTLRETKSGLTFINKPDDQRLILGVKEAIANYQDWLIIGVTNQGGVGSGHKTLEDATKEQQLTLELLPQMACILFCPDMRGETCWMVPRAKPPKLISNKRGNFRKPGDGMLQYAQYWALNHSEKKDENEIEEILMIGDREEDRQAAQTANIKFIWAEDWRNSASGETK